jgi:hypothetical protein
MIERKTYRRKSYRRSDGTLVKATRVSASRIKSTRAPGEREVKREVWASKVERAAKRRRISPKRKSCKKGYIMRDGYVRKSYKRISRDGKKKISVKRTKVSPVCVKDVGKKGKTVGPLIGPLKEGSLGKFGYSDALHMSANERHEALERAVKKMGWLPTYRKLNAVWVLNRNTNPKLASIFKADRNWVKRNFEGFRPE